ncbi:MAG: nucleotidyltransferase family protein [Sedimentisphaerales bacterium]|nr:nucleotidyltransferase family protein [Sedimentisphaerales bacterium]
MMPPAAILSGGLATRLYPVTQDVPKAMLDVAGEPFIGRQLKLLKERGVAKVVICAGYLGEQIKDFAGDGAGFGLSVDYSFDGNKPLGTGGALMKALPLLGDVFFVMYGDSYLDTEFAPIVDFFLSRNKKGLMTVLKNENNWDRSNVVYKNREIIRYNKENPTQDMKHIDYGLALLRRSSLADAEKGRAWDLADLYAELVDEGQMLGYEVKERFYEIGSFQGLEETREHLQQLSTHAKRQ